MTVPLPVLLYHSIDDDPPSWIAPFTVGRRRFAAQLDAIAASGRVAVSSAEVVEARRGGAQLPENAVLITFDDGYRNFVTSALPELDRRDLPATLFVTTGALGRVNKSLLPDAPMLTFAQVAQLADAGVEIGAHAHLHAQLDTLRTVEIVEELSLSKWILEDVLGRAVNLFAYPHGYSNAEVRRLTRETGYQGAFAVGNAFSPDTDDPFRVARLMLRSDTARADLEAWLRGAGAPSAPAHEHVKTVCWRMWRRERARLWGQPTIA
ncbi:MAG TPA: polysaccharide deacetylase family protein [Actinocrinis sp.]|nr:polysaccharide deacetylase family protein [Actinocrinis sp.]